MEEFTLQKEIIDELQRARSKFPDQNIWITLAALTEEVGELNKAVLHHTFGKPDGSLKDVRAEAVQVATMAMRVVLDTKMDQQ